MKKERANTILMAAAIPFLIAGNTNGVHAAERKQDNRPNILFCIADDASFHHFSRSGCEFVDTPNFDKVAENGIFFERCYTPNAKSAPSRAILLTGRYSWQLGEAGNHICRFPAEVKAFTEVLQECGYQVAYTGKGWGPGNPGVLGDGSPRRLTGKEYNTEKLTPPAKGINTCNYIANFKNFLDEKEEGQPWFFWFGCREPHRKYAYGSGVQLGNRKTSDIKEVPGFWPDNETVRNDLLDYGFEIEHYDEQLGKMIDELEKRGMLDNTLIVVTSDNGMPFPRCKANDYEYANHMPCAMMWPEGIRHPGRSSDSFISFVDMAPTFLELAGADASVHGMVEPSGRSLVSILEDRASKKELRSREEIILGRERDDYGRPHNQGYPIRAIISGDLLYIWNVKPDRWPAGDPETGYLDVDGSPTKTVMLSDYRHGKGKELWQLSFGIRPEKELYDLAKDPWCINNLANDPAMAETLEKLSARLKEELLRLDDPRMHGGGDEFDNFRFDREDKWNFYERVMSGEIPEPWRQTLWVTPTDYDQHPANRKEAPYRMHSIYKNRIKDHSTMTTRKPTL